MKRVFKWLSAGVLLGVGLFWLLTSSREVQFERPDSYRPDLANGELVFHAGGCASCHGAGLEGGLEMITAFGTFRVPNISPDPGCGIGSWGWNDFMNAKKPGRSPDGRPYYPAFPYASYARATVRDLLDLKAFIDSMPGSQNAVAGHEISFPWNVR